MKKITELDGIRGIAILLVLIWHCFATQVLAQYGTPLYYLQYMSALTWSGVDLFFVLSGFLIGGILLDRRSSKNYFKTFFIRRICRIIPLYIMLILVFVFLNKTAPSGLRWLFIDPYPLWSYLTFTQNYFMSAGGTAWLGITWSLAIEEQFYLTLPFIICYVRTKWLVPVCIIMIIGSAVARYLIDGFGSYVYTFSRVDALMSGVLLALLVRTDSFLPLMRKYIHLVITMFLLLLLVFAYMTFILTQPGDVVNHSVFALFYSLLILLAIIYQGNPLAGILRSSVLCWLGTRSYGIYLFHLGISTTVQAYFGIYPPRISNIDEAMLTFTALIITMVLAELSFRYYESPFIRMGHKFSYGPQIINKKVFQAT